MGRGRAGRGQGRQVRAVRLFGWWAGMKWAQPRTLLLLPCRLPAYHPLPAACLPTHIYPPLPTHLDVGVEHVLLRGNDRGSGGQPAEQVGNGADVGVDPFPAHLLQGQHGGQQRGAPAGGCRHDGQARWGADEGAERELPEPTIISPSHKSMGDRTEQGRADRWSINCRPEVHSLPRQHPRPSCCTSPPPEQLLLMLLVAQDGVEGDAAPQRDASNEEGQAGLEARDTHPRPPAAVHLPAHVQCCEGSSGQRHRCNWTAAVNSRVHSPAHPDAHPPTH